MHSIALISALHRIPPCANCEFLKADTTLLPWPSVMSAMPSIPDTWIVPFPDTSLVLDRSSPIVLSPSPRFAAARDVLPSRLSIGTSFKRWRRFLRPPQAPFPDAGAANNAATHPRRQLALMLTSSPPSAVAAADGDGAR
jgi:hypothetical protein